MKIAILLVIIPIAFMFACIGWLMLKDKIAFKEDGMEYVSNRVTDSTVFVKDNNKEGNIRKLSGVLLVVCGIFMVILPAIML